nr:MAG TPA_asm: E2-like protein [Caudoviricetes sp.]
MLSRSSFIKFCKRYSLSAVFSVLCHSCRCINRK